MVYSAIGILLCGSASIVLRTLHTYRRVSAVFVFMGFVACASFAQVDEYITTPCEVYSISFDGNETFSSGKLEDAILSKETPGFFSKFLYSVFGEKLGSKPEYLDDLLLQEDVKRLKQYYESYGYFGAVITEEVKKDSAENSCAILFHVKEGVQSLIDSISVSGLEKLPEELQEEILSEPLIKKGDPYEPAKGRAENIRILTILAEHGFPLARIDKERSGAYHRASTNNFQLVFTYILGKWFQVGDINVRVDPPRADITEDLIVRQLEFVPGEEYSRQKAIASERALNRLDLFEAVRIEEPTITDTTPSSIVPINIFVKPRDRHEISPEITVSDENNTFNLGLGIGYTNRNFFGDARLFTAKARVRAQSLLEWNLGDVIFKGNGLNDSSATGAVELQLQVVQPYLFTRTLSGSWTTTLSSEKQKAFTLDILRNKIGVSNQFATYTYGLAEWTLERVSPFLDTSKTHQTPYALTLVENQKQFNSILTLTLQRDKTNDIFSPTEGFFNSVSLEESGILPNLLPGIADTLPYTQYYKVVLFGRWYQDLSNSKFNILALKARGGYQEKYGESKYKDVNIPLNRRFFGGGSGSVRGWKARELGAMPDSLLPFGGNFILEGNAEMRVNHFRGFGKLLWLELDNVWMVYYLDAGNVWSSIKDFHLQEVAVAAGFGFRYETLFGPFRIDFGFPVYDPKGPEGKQTIFQKRFWGDTFSNGVFHFGIGHAF